MGHISVSSMNVECIADVKYMLESSIFMLEHSAYTIPFDQKENRMNKNIKFNDFNLESFGYIVWLNILYIFEWENRIFQFHRI